MGKRTDTDVIITQRSARFGYPHGALGGRLDFVGRKEWQLGEFRTSERMNHRRRWTVAQDLLACDNTTDISDDMRRRYKGLGARDSEFRAILLKHDSGAIVFILEQVKR